MLVSDWLINIFYYFKKKNALISITVRDKQKMEIWDIFAHFEKKIFFKKFKKLKFAFISEKVRDRAKQAKFGDHMHSPCSQ